MAITESDEGGNWGDVLSLEQMHKDDYNEWLLSADPESLMAEAQYVLYTVDGYRHETGYPLQISSVCNQIGRAFDDEDPEAVLAGLLALNGSQWAREERIGAKGPEEGTVATERGLSAAVGRPEQAGLMLPSHRITSVGDWQWPFPHTTRAAAEGAIPSLRTEDVSAARAIIAPCSRRVPSWEYSPRVLLVLRMWCAGGDIQCTQGTPLF